MALFDKGEKPHRKTEILDDTVGLTPSTGKSTKPKARNGFNFNGRSNAGIKSKASSSKGKTVFPRNQPKGGLNSVIPTVRARPDATASHGNEASIETRPRPAPKTSVPKNSIATKRFLASMKTDSKLSRAKNMNPSTSTVHSAKFYEADGLRIPLYDSQGKKYVFARDGQALSHKTSKPELLDIIKSYAGETKAGELRDRKRKQLGAWIQEAETKAFGNGPQKQNHDTTHQQLQKTNNKVGSGGKEHDSPVGRRLSVAGSSELRAPALTKDDDSQEKLIHSEKSHVKKRMRVEKKYDPTLNPQQTLKKAKLEASTCEPTHDTAPQLHTNTVMARKKKPIKQTAAHPKVRNNQTPNTYAAKPSSILKTKMPASAINTTDSRKRAGEGTRIPENTQVSNDDKAFKATATTPGVPDLPPKRARQGSIHTKTVTVIIGDPHSSQDTLEIPWSDFKLTRNAVARGKSVLPPSARQRQYLRPGKHGWDAEKGTWAYAGHPSLITGEGHQVEPADRALLESGVPKEREAYFQKYPGRLGGFWPCGCKIPADEGEEESDADDM